MPHVIGQQRNQLIMLCLESSISGNAFVRVIDAFVDATDLESFGFAHTACKEEGRPSFHPSVLLKLYLYGYQNGIRSSRKLEREARLNMEAIWLTSGQNLKYKTIADFRKNHSSAFHALAQMAKAANEILNAESLDVLADKGYHTGEELNKCEDENITAYVSPKAPSTPDNGLYPVTTFTYNPEDDTYTCPAGETLHTNNVWYKHSVKGKTEAYRFRRYTTPACKICIGRSRCTAGEKNGRAIDRSEYAPAIDVNRERVTAKPDYYRLRQQITEHAFGTLKRQLGFTFTLMKGKSDGIILYRPK
jgi:transposase